MLFKAIMKLFIAKNICCLYTYHYETMKDIIEMLFLEVKEQKFIDKIIQLIF